MYKFLHIASVLPLMTPSVKSWKKLMINSVRLYKTTNSGENESELLGLKDLQRQSNKLKGYYELEPPSNEILP